MTPRRMLLAGGLAAAALAVSAPAAGAATPPGLPGTVGPGSGTCSGVVVNPGEIRTGDAEHQQCAVLGFIGPSVGQIASVVGPTIISPSFVGTAVVSAGNVVIGVG
jgi:hypothetical protein